MRRPQMRPPARVLVVPIPVQQPRVGGSPAQVPDPDLVQRAGVQGRRHVAPRVVVVVDIVERKPAEAGPVPVDKGGEAAEVEVVDALDGEGGEAGPGEAGAERFVQPVFRVEVGGPEAQAFELRHRLQEADDVARGHETLAFVEVRLFEVEVEVFRVGHEGVDRGLVRRVGDAHGRFAQVAEQRASVDPSPGDGPSVGDRSQDQGALVRVKVRLTGARLPYSVDRVVVGRDVEPPEVPTTTGLELEIIRRDIGPPATPVPVQT